MPSPKKPLKKKEFTIHYTAKITGCVIVEATTKKEARDMAMDAIITDYSEGVHPDNVFNEKIVSLKEEEQEEETDDRIE